MNREYIIIIICIFFVGFFYIQSEESSSTQPVEQIETIPSDVDDTTKITLPDSLGI